MTTAVQVEKKTISVIIIEDFKLTRVGLRCALNANEDIKVVAESDNAIDGLKLIEKFSPNIVLMDLGLAGMNGIEATMKIKEMNRDIKVIALTSHDREEEVIASLSAGAMAYCLKDIDPAKLADVIRDVVNGVCWFGIGFIFDKFCNLIFKTKVLSDIIFAAITGRSPIPLAKQI